MVLVPRCRWGTVRALIPTDFALVTLEVPGDDRQDIFREKAPLNSDLRGPFQGDLLQFELAKLSLSSFLSGFKF